MFRILLATAFVMICVTGCADEEQNCSSDAKEVEFENLMQEDGVVYQKGSDTPFTGTAVRTYPDGRRTLTDFRNGIGNGRSLLWHPNGTKAMEATLVDNEVHGMVIKWDENGEEISRVEYIRGEPVKN